jgi:predicted metal-dependent phosphoesterase TrpH
VAGLAHPVFSQEPGWPERLAGLPARLDRYVAGGLQAVECYYPDATPEITQKLLEWTRQRGLVVTGGTDYHGPGKAPFAPLGQVSVDGATVEALRALR